jgi:hypothetical protein
MAKLVVCCIGTLDEPQQRPPEQAFSVLDDSEALAGRRVAVRQGQNSEVHHNGII